MTFQSNRLLLYTMNSIDIKIRITLKETRDGRDAEIIGEATKEFSMVAMKTVVDRKRILIPPIGDPVPRIC